MLMDTAESGDQFGVNFNWEFVLLQIKEIGEEYSEARIKLSLNDVDQLMELLSYYKEKLLKWKNAVGNKLENESDIEYATRIHSALRENNYFLSKQED